MSSTLHLSNLVSNAFKFLDCTISLLRQFHRPLHLNGKLYFLISFVQIATFNFLLWPLVSLPILKKQIICISFIYSHHCLEQHNFAASLSSSMGWQPQFFQSLFMYRAFKQGTILIAALCILLVFFIPLLKYGNNSITTYSNLGQNQNYY